MIPFVFDTGEDRRVFVFSRDPAVVEANSIDALERYRETGDIGALEVPDNATRFRLRPVAPNVIAAIQAAALARIEPAAVEAWRRCSKVAKGEMQKIEADLADLLEAAAPAIQAAADCKRPIVAFALENVDTWQVEPSAYGNVLDAMARSRPDIAGPLVDELYTRVERLSGLGALGK